MSSNRAAANEESMDLTPTEDEQLLRDTVRRFFTDRAPMTAVRATAESAEGYDPAVLAEAASLDWIGLAVDPAQGGVGLRFVDLAILAEEVGRALIPGPLLPTSIVALLLAEHGTSAQRQAHLPGLLSGETVGVWASAEPDTDWEPRSAATSAKRDDAGYTLHGAKRYAPYAHAADLLVVTAVVDDTVQCLLVPAGAEGVHIDVLETLDLTNRLCEVRLDGVHVPPDAVLGALGDPTPVDRLRQLATTLACAESLGGAARMVEMTNQYAKERVQFGRPIGSFQAIKHKCADMLIALEGARVATHYAALAVSEQTADADLAVSVAKAFTSEAYSDICGEGLQVHAGIGFTWEHDVHLYLRRAKSNEVLWGSPRWHRERIAATVA